MRTLTLSAAHVSSPPPTKNHDVKALDFKSCSSVRRRLPCLAEDTLRMTLVLSMFLIPPLFSLTRARLQLILTKEENSDINVVSNATCTTKFLAPLDKFFLGTVGSGRP